MDTATDLPPLIGIPRLASELGVSLWVLMRFIGRREDLAGLITHVDGRRIVRRKDVEAIRKALVSEGKL